MEEVFKKIDELKSMQNNHFAYIESMIRRIKHQQILFQRQLLSLDQTVRSQRRKFNLKLILKKSIEVMGGDAFKYLLVYFLNKKTFIKKIAKRRMPISIYGNRTLVRLFSRDLDFLYSILIGEDYNGKLIGEYDITLPKSSEFILDLGANIGLFSILFATRFPQKRIIAVEPEKKNYSMLKYNTKNFKNIEIIKGAIWFEDGLVELNKSRVLVGKNKIGSEGSYYVTQSKSDSDGIETVNALSIGTIISSYGIKSCVVKMDIEGAECEVFEKGDLEWLDYCSMLIIETHERFFEGSTIDMKIRDIMMSRKFEESVLGENKIYTFCGG